MFVHRIWMNMKNQIRGQSKDLPFGKKIKRKKKQQNAKIRQKCSCPLANSNRSSKRWMAMNKKITFIDLNNFKRKRYTKDKNPIQQSVAILFLQCRLNWTVVFKKQIQTQYGIFVIVWPVGLNSFSLNSEQKNIAHEFLVIFIGVKNPSRITQIHTAFLW